MGMLDQEVMFADGQAVTATGDTASTNIYDTSSGQTNPGNGQGDAGLTGENLWLRALVRTAVTSGGAATVQAVFQDSADNSTYADVATGPVVVLASLTAGASLMRLQPPVGTRRYWRFVFRVATAVLTAGTFDAFVSNTTQYNISRASGIPAVG